MPQLIQAIWRCTKGPTLGKSLTYAQRASFPALQLVNWKITWWGCTQEKSLSSVTSAIMLALNLVISRATWGRTRNSHDLDQHYNFYKSSFKCNKWSITIILWSTSVLTWPKLTFLFNFEIQTNKVIICISWQKLISQTNFNK